jgi:MoxR-like ATPase
MRGSSVNASVDPGTVYRLIADNVQQVIQGKPDVVRLAVTALFAEGHLLIEDVPGTGKTSLAVSLARSIGAQVRRIQFTPDLLPAEITGNMVFHQRDEEFRFHPGAIFTNIVLTDEINRGTPKTQSALLEVMAERRVTVDGVTHAVPRPFMVVATQNPIELDGTYPLPEAQLDRFLMRVSMGYPDHDAEVRVVLGNAAGVDPDRLGPVVDLPILRRIIAQVLDSRVDPQICDYAVRIVADTRRHSAVRYGASPRGSVALIRAARAYAWTAGRSYVTPDDVKDIARAVLAHRIILTPDAELNRHSAADVVAEVMAAIPVPGAAGTARR